MIAMPDKAAASTSLRAFADKVFPSLGQRSYYQLLNLPAGTSDAAVVRAAYYRLAGQLHPDRFLAVADSETRERLEIIYARVSEAYRVLSSAERRAAYDAGLAAGKLRLDLSQRVSGALKTPEDSLKHPEARKFYRLAQACAGDRDWKGAVLNLNFARSFEPDAAVLAEKLAEAQAAVTAQKTGAR
jgi:curved DNA-binding protein CbpA